MPEQPSTNCGSFVPCLFSNNVDGETPEQRKARVNSRIRRFALVAMIYGNNAFRSQDYDFSSVSGEDVGHIKHLFSMSKTGYAQRLDKTISAIKDENTKSLLRIAAWENYDFYHMLLQMQLATSEKAQQTTSTNQIATNQSSNVKNDVPEKRKRIGFFPSEPKTRLSRDEKDRLLGWQEFVDNSRKTKWYMCDTFGQEIYFTGKTVLEAGLLPKDVLDLLNHVPGAQMSPPEFTFIPGKEKGYTVKEDLFFSQTFNIDKDLGLVGMYMFKVDHVQMYKSNYLVTSQTVLWDKNRKVKPMGSYYLNPYGRIDWKETFEESGSFWHEEELQAAYKTFQKQTPIDLPYEQKDFLAAGGSSKKEEERERPSWLWSSDDN